MLDNAAGASRTGDDAVRERSSNSGETLGAILDVLPAMVGYWDHDLRNRFANRAYLEFLGQSPQEILGRHISEILGSDLFARDLPYLERALAGEPQLFDRMIIDRAGNPRHAQACYTPDVRDGVVCGVVVLVTDITARRTAEGVQAAAETRFRELLESAPDAMVLIDAAGEIVFTNTRVDVLFGYAPSGLIGQPIEVLIPDRFRAQHVTHRSHFVRDPRVRAMGAELELFGRREDGSEFPVEISLSPLTSGQDSLVLSAIRDVTDRKRIEHELRRNQIRLAEAERVARTGSWEWDIANDELNWSAGLFALYGLAPEDFDGTFEGARRRVYPEDRDRFTSTLQDAIAQRSSFSFEFRAMFPGGRVRTLRNHGEVVVDDAGLPIRLVGVLQDITEARIAQEMLHNTSAALERRAAILNELALSSATAPAPAIAPLTERQQQIIHLIAQGLTNAAIGQRLFLTEGTIKWHVKQILTKTNSTNRAEAVARVLGSVSS